MQAIDLFCSVKSNTLFSCGYYPKQSSLKPAKCAVIISAFEAEEFNFQWLMFEAKCSVILQLKMDYRHAIALCIHLFHCFHPQFIDPGLPLTQALHKIHIKMRPVLKDPTWLQADLYQTNCKGGLIHCLGPWYPLLISMLSIFPRRKNSDINLFQRQNIRNHF